MSLVYSDEDRVDDDGNRCDPVFKPAFDSDALLSFNYIGRLAAIRKDLVESVGGFRNQSELREWDLLVRLMEVVDGRSIGHIAKPLYHRRDSGAPPPPASAVRKVLEDHAARTKVKTEPGARGRIAVILRSADGVHQQRAVRRTRDDDVSLYELAEGSLLTPGDLDAEVLVFLNGPVECFNHAFFEELSKCAKRRDCGLAGPLVLDPDGNILSAGALCGSGGAVRDPFRGLPFFTTAHMDLSKLMRPVASISTRCFAVSKSRLLTAGALEPISADDLPKLCERLVMAAHGSGAKVLYNPNAVLTASDFDPAPALSVCLDARAPRLNPNIESFDAITSARVEAIH
jgi:hypothetical protein